MDITLIDDSIRFDSLAPTTRPLGGAEKAFASVPGGLVKAGHKVTVINRCHANMTLDGVKWRTFDSRRDHPVDALIAFRQPTLLGAMRRAKTRALWVTAHPRYLEAEANRELLDSLRPYLIFVSDAQRALYTGDLPTAVIPPAARIDYHRDAPMAPAVPPRAIVTTHPLHGLEWLINLWTTRIRPHCPGAELHVYSATMVKALAGEEVAEGLLSVARALMDARASGVSVRRPDGDMYMVDDFLQARVHLHPGHAEDWGCWTLAETQALGLPAVARPLGAAAERLGDAKTGCLAKNDDDFVRQTLQILNQDKVFMELSANARARGRARNWDKAAMEFAALLEGSL